MGSNTKNNNEIIQYESLIQHCATGQQLKSGSFRDHQRVRVERCLYNCQDFAKRSINKYPLKCVKRP